MKKLLLSALMACTFAVANAQCTDLFFSEYVEGSNNNKALELYNPTTSPITISSTNQYRIVRYNNGTNAATAEANVQAYQILGTPAHTIMPGDVWVLVIDKRNPLGTGNETPVDPALQAVADTFICPDYNVSYAVYHNGNDALSLQKYVGGNWVYVDIFGEIGTDPGQSWTDVFPYDDSAPGAAYWTKDQTLIRKASVMNGVTTNPSPFIAPTEWDSLPINTFSNLGTHTCNCPTVGVNEVSKYSEVKIFPNPSTNNALNILSADKKVERVVLYNAIGQEVKNVKFENASVKTQIDLNLPAGIYITKVIFTDDSSTTEKLIIK